MNIHRRPDILAIKALNEKSIWWKNILLERKEKYMIYFPFNTNLFWPLLYGWTATPLFVSPLALTLKTLRKSRSCFFLSQFLYQCKVTWKDQVSSTLAYISNRHLLVQSKLRKHQSNMRNMLKVNNSCIYLMLPLLTSNK